MSYLITFLITFCISFITYFILRYQLHEKFTKKEKIFSYCILILGSLICSLKFHTLFNLKPEFWIYISFLSTFIGYLAFQTLTDVKNHMLYVYASNVFMFIGMIYVFLNSIFNSPIQQFTFNLFINAMLQLFVFSRFYGAGDVRMEITCSLFFARNTFAYTSQGIIVFMIQMSIALIIFTIKNLLKKNIGKKFRLIEKDAFAPYLAIGSLFVI